MEREELYLQLSMWRIGELKTIMRLISLDEHWTRIL